MMDLNSVMKHIILTKKGPNVSLDHLQYAGSSKSKVSQWIKNNKNTPKRERLKKNVVKNLHEVEEDTKDDEGDETQDGTSSREWKFYDVNFGIDSDSGSSLETEDWTPSECGSFREKMRAARKKKLLQKGISFEPTRVLPSRGKKTSYKTKRRGRVYDW